MKQRIGSQRARRRMRAAALPIVLALALAACRPTLTVVDGLPSGDRVVFNRIGATLADSPEDTHDVSVIRISNHYDRPLAVTGATFTNLDNGALPAPWQLVNPGLVPGTVPPRGDLDVAVRFVATGGLQIQRATITFTFDDPDQPTLALALRGNWETAPEAGEPPLRRLVNDLFGFKTDMGTTINTGGQPIASGEEVFSAYWQKGDPNWPVVIRQIAAYHTGGANAPYGLLSWVPQGGSANLLFGNGVPHNQTLLPIDATGAPRSGAFHPTTPFSLKIDGESTIDAENLQECTGCGHHVRFWPLRDTSGNLVAGTYIVAMDYVGATMSNYDFNDNVYLITNVAPVPVA